MRHKLSLDLTPRFPWLLVMAAALVLGCPTVVVEPDPEIEGGRETGQSDFLSAHEGSNGFRGDEEADMDDGMAAPPDEAAPGGEERTVEEGDIYRVLSGSLILNLNSFRGLQVIDFSDVNEPKIVGRAAVAGHPVELYVHGQHAFVLMNDWRGYSGRWAGRGFEQLEGGLVLAVDLSDPTAPAIVDQARVPGSIRTSRLVHGGGQAALYVAAAHHSWGRDEGGDWREHVETYVRSFEVTGGRIELRSEIDLGGFVSDIQATPRALLVASNERWWSRDPSHSSRVSVIDISSPDGTMVQGGEVQVAGYVFTQFNMDLYNDVLRVVSGSRWGSRPANYIETFDATDISDLTRIDVEEFGAGEDLYATLFLGNKAFFVTYWQVDPFHAFEITDEGIATEMSEFVVSGWNDYFRPVFGESRLIGIGKNDEQGSQQAVSLYDITDLTNPEPMIARQEVDMRWSWSEAQWDHRAFSVLMDAVDVLTADGERETGMVLLPFSGWDDEARDGRGQYRTAVQIFTFSEDTLTRRGVMQHPSQVRRSFLADDEAVANLSETDLAFFDHSDPDHPAPLGSVELAPDYSDYFVFGEHAARRRDERSYWYYWDDGDWASHVEMVSASADPDLSEPLASFDIDPRSSLHQVGDLLVSIGSGYGYHEWGPRGANGADGQLQRALHVHDLSDPLEPRRVGQVDIAAIDSGDGYGWEEVVVVGDGLVVLRRQHKSEVLGVEETCRLDDYGWCGGGEGEDEDCVIIYGGDHHCTRSSSGAIECVGTVQRCRYVDGRVQCELVDVNEIEDLERRVHCWERQIRRSWTELTLHPVDLSNPAEPVLRAPIQLGRRDEGMGAVVDGSDLYVSFRRPVRVDGDHRGWARYFFQRFDFSSYRSPRAAEPVNVPGVLLAVDGDMVFTRDQVWSGNRIDTAVARCEVRGGRAYLRGVRRFPERVVESMTLDGRGHLLVTHGPGYGWYGYPDYPMGSDDAEDSGVSSDEESRRMHTMTVLDVMGADFPVLSEAEVDTWATLEDAREGRALFRVPGGLLVLSLEDPADPAPQAFFATRGWPRSIRVQDDHVVFAAGRHGIYRFAMDVFNLMEE